MPDIFYMFILIVMAVGGGAFLIVFGKKAKEKKKKTDKILSIILTSKITSLSIIANTSGLSTSEVSALVEEMIEKANGQNAEYKMIKNAYIDYAQNEVVLDPHAYDTILNKIGDSVNSVLDRFAPKKEIKKDWTCQYCKTLNRAEGYTCTGCGANHVAG